ncbi:MAG: ABC transporter substrate-binding protein [Clostridia bacterium]|nr:ABC transporter substrate-binding protein [Clostridia bacterium]
MKKFVKVMCLALVLVMAMGCFAACGNTPADNDGDNSGKTYVIGVSGPLTGPAAVYGQAVKNSAQMAVDEINAAGGLNGVQFKLVALDDKHDPANIAANYAALYEQGMHVSLGCVTTAPGLEFTNFAKEDNVFFLTPSASGDAITGGHGYQMCFADGNQGKVAAEYVNEAYAGKTIGVFYKSDDPYSKGIYDQFVAALDASVSTVVTSFSAANETSFATQIDTLKECEFVFMPIYAAPAALFMTQATNVMKANAVYYGCDGLDGIESVKGFDITTVPQEVSMLSHFNSKATEGAAKEFVDKYVAKYGKDTLNQFGASAYDCVYAIFGAMKKVENVSPDMSASDMCDALKAEFNGGYTFTNGATGETVKWNTDGSVNKMAVKFVVKEADAQ